MLHFSHSTSGFFGFTSYSKHVVQRSLSSKANARVDLRIRGSGTHSSKSPVQNRKNTRGEEVDICPVRYCQRACVLVVGCALENVGECSRACVRDWGTMHMMATVHDAHEQLHVSERTIVVSHVVAPIL